MFFNNTNQVFDHVIRKIKIIKLIQNHSYNNFL
jgi:hypothetical protein